MKVTPATSVNWRVGGWINISLFACFAPFYRQTKNVASSHKMCLWGKAVSILLCLALLVQSTGPVIANQSPVRVGYNVHHVLVNEAENCLLDLAYGSTIDCTSVSGQVRSHTFTGAAGDQIIVRVLESEGSLSPDVRIYRPNATEVCKASTIFAFLELLCTLDTSGVHTLTVVGANAHYTLHLQRTNNPANLTATTYGSTVSGAITPSPEIDVYGFTGVAGDRVQIRVLDTGANLSPDVRVYRPDGTQVCKQSTIFALLELPCTLNASGVHTIFIGGGNSNYTLYLQRTNNPANITTITYGNTMAGAITPSPKMDVYGFTGTAGDQALIRVLDIGGGLSPDVRVYRPDGTEACRKSTIFALLELVCALDASGIHTISIGGGNSNYALYLQRTNSPINARPIGAGVSLAGAIDPVPEMDVYVFSGKVGNHITVQVTDTGGNLSPDVRIYRPDGSKLCGNSTILAKLELQCDLDTSGIHALFVGGGNSKYSIFLLGADQTPIPVSLTLSQTVSSQIQPNQLQYFSLDLASTGQPLLLTVNPLSGIQQLWVEGRFGDLPTPGRADVITLEPTVSSSYELLFAPARAGRYYFSVFGRAVALPQGEYAITARLVDHYFSDVQPRTGGNAAALTLNVAGLGFGAGLQVELRGAGLPTHTADQVVPTSATDAWARFALTGATPGVYDTWVRWPDGAELTLARAFTLTVGVGARLDAQLSAPETVRRGREAVLWLEYANTGDADMPAPIFVITSTQGTLLRSATNQIYTLDPVQLMGASAEEPAGVLRPGDSQRIPVYFNATEAGTAEFSISSVIADSTPIDWETIGAELKPTDMTPALWDAIWVNFTREMGAIWADYQGKLDDQLTYLAQHGGAQLAPCAECAAGATLRPVHEVSDLLAAFLSRAAGAYPQRTLAASVDAYAADRGLPLVFARTALNTLQQRFTIGPFGRGWSHSFEYTLSRPEEAQVILRGPGGSGRTFTRDARGLWQPAPGDVAVLTESGGTFRLREADGLLWLFEASGRLANAEEPNGNRITLIYDGAGRLATVSHSNGQSFTLEYNGQGRISRLTDHAGQTTQYGYDGSGEHLVNVNAPGGVTTGYAYVAPGGETPDDHAIQAITFPDGSHQYYAYDAQGRVAAQWRDGDTERVEFSYDGLGSVFVKDATGAETRLRLGVRGELLAAQDPLGNHVRFQYDENFNLVRLVGPDGAVSGLSRDGLGNVSQSVNALGHNVILDYETQFSRLNWLRDGHGNVTDFATDSRGNLTAITYPDFTSETFGYDNNGNLTGVKNRRGQTISYTYDAAGRITRKLYPDGRTIDYSYDPQDNLLSGVDSATGAITMQYDARNFLTRIEYPGGRWFTFEYNNAGLRTRRTGHDGFVLHYAYDAAGRLVRLSDSANVEHIRYTYDTVGRLSREDKGNGTYTTYAYDSAGRLLSLVNAAPGNTVQSRFDYTYAVSGNRTSMTTLDGKTSYDYDATGQLIGVTYPDGHRVTYIYDAAGNRISVTDNGVSTAYTTNKLNQYTGVGNDVYTYDADGNMTTKTDATGTTSYAYDAENRLIRVSTPVSGTWQYTYDALGNRVAVDHDGAVTRYLHDPIGLVDVAAEYGGGDALVARYVHGIGLIARVDAAGDPAYYGFDGTGHTRQLSSVGGNAINNYDYDPYGIVLRVTESIPNPFQYVGRLGVIAERNGLQFMRARYYDNKSGRFLHEDPLNLTGGLNLYSYTSNSPINFIDPFGLVDVGGFFGGLGLAVGGALGIVASYGAAPATGGASLIATVPSAYAFGVGIGNMMNALSDIQPFLEGGLFGDIAKASPDPLVQSLGNLVDAALPYAGPKAAKFSGWLGRLQDLYEQYDNYEAFKSIFESWKAILRQLKPILDRIPKIEIEIVIIIVIAPRDPNEKIASTGSGPQSSVKPDVLLPYTIYFENVITATAPAQEVVILDALDPDLDWTTFQPSELAFGDQVLAVSAPTGGYATRLTVPDHRTGVTKTWWVDITAEIDHATGTAKWTFRTLDPQTGQLPEDPLAGFLPPNDTTGRGEGHVSFTVRPRQNLPLLTPITNRAVITFDTETSITTNEVRNTIAYVLFLPVIHK